MYIVFFRLFRYDACGQFSDGFKEAAMLLEARGKINWALKVLGKRADGYHLLDMLMQPVSLCDDITLEPAASLSLTTSGFPKLKPTPDHLALRAALALQEAAGVKVGAKLHVHKRIPVGAGMGGGSADAAGVLVGLNRLWQLGLSTDALCDIGLTIGADVPFCIRGGLMRVGGIGETMAMLPAPRSYWLVVVQPCRGLSTRDVFGGCVVPALIPAESHLLPGIQAIQQADFQLMRQSLSNDLQPISEAMRPLIQSALQRLAELGAAFSMMTGSGSAVFGVFRSATSARHAAAQLRPLWRSVFMCHTCQESIHFIDPN